MTAATEITFKTTPVEFELIRKIADRAQALEREHAEPGFRPRTRQSWLMDISACHANGNPLRLSDMLAADNFNFIHDAFGIARHLDRNTGKLTGFFSPRFSQRSAA